MFTFTAATSNDTGPEDEETEDPTLTRVTVIALARFEDKGLEWLVPDKS